MKYKFCRSKTGYKLSRKSRSRSPQFWTKRSRSRSRSHSRQIRKRLTPPASPPSSHSKTKYSSSSKVKYAPTSLASELSKHRKAREMKMRDAQIAASLRQSGNDLNVSMERKKEFKQKLERTSLTPPRDRRSAEQSNREPEYSKKERLLEAMEANIVVKVENVKHDSPSKKEKRQVEEKKTVKSGSLDRNLDTSSHERSLLEQLPHDELSVDKPVHDISILEQSAQDIVVGEVKEESVDGYVNPVLQPSATSPGLENVSDVEPSPAEK